MLHYYTILYHTILYYIILCHTIPYHTIPYYTILYYTILYYTIIMYYRADGPSLPNGTRSPRFSSDDFSLCRLQHKVQYKNKKHNNINNINRTTINEKHIFFSLHRLLVRRRIPRRQFCMTRARFVW